MNQNCLKCFLAILILGGLLWFRPGEEAQKPAVSFSVGQTQEPDTHARSPKWPKVRAEHLKSHPECEACGYVPKAGEESNQVHHITPYHVDRGRELDPENLITLCGPGHRNCHLIFGHGCTSYRGWNPHVKDDAQFIRSRIRECEEIRSKWESKQQKLD